MPDSRPRLAAQPPLPPGWWPAAIVVALGLIYLALEVGAVRPYLPPAGLGAWIAGDATLAGAGEGRLLVARPPLVEGGVRTASVRAVADGSPAAGAGLRPGDEIVSQERLPTGRIVAVSDADRADPLARIRVWRNAYWAGLRGQVGLTVRGADGLLRRVDLERPAVWAAPGSVVLAWVRVHGGLLVQVLAFIGAGAVLLALRPRDATAQFTIAALVLSAVAAAGPLMGSEALAPPGLREALVVFAWLGAPLAFPAIALAIEHFPRASPLVERHRFLLALPFVVASPMIITALVTSLFLAGVDGLAGAAAWDAAHPQVFFGSFAAALGVNIAALGEGLWRYRHNSDHQERRRVVLAVATLAIATAAYTVKDGLPALMLATTGMTITYPWWVMLLLYLMVALPAAGVTYAVAVHRVLAPRVAVRRSLQYALARKTLTAVAMLPTVLLVVSLVRQRDRSLAEVITGAPVFYAVLLALLILAIRFREQAETWLDRRFFRAEYDARAVLVSLAGRVPYETDPNELTALVVSQVDAALHPTMMAVLVSGLEPGILTPVSALHGKVGPLGEAGALATLLQWSDEPLDVDLADPRSPARRLPPEEIAWLQAARAVLIVPLLAGDSGTRRLLGAMALGEKRSEEPYTAEDRELLASIAGQVALALDVARLRRHSTPAGIATAGLTTAGTPSTLVVECPTCGHCDEPGTGACPVDRTPLRLGALPRIVEAKYRVERLLGRGGMGAVYRARDMRLDRDVAIKVVRADRLSQPDARARFRREAQLVARLQHPGVVSVFDYGTLPEGAAFLVMEFVRGRNLRAALRESGAMNAERVLEIMSAIAEAVEAAHRVGILHRDLKPENILLPEDGVTAKVLDFGIAKAVTADDVEGEETLTMTGQTIGTPAYMAPEQLAGTHATPRTDVFALGVIACELLTGEAPFGRGSLVEIATRQQRGLASLPGPAGTVPPGMRDAILAALSLDPGARPPTAASFAAALGRTAGVG